MNNKQKFYLDLMRYPLSDLKILALYKGINPEQSKKQLVNQLAKIQSQQKASFEEGLAEKNKNLILKLQQRVDQINQKHWSYFTQLNLHLYDISDKNPEKLEEAYNLMNQFLDQYENCVDFKDMINKLKNIAKEQTEEDPLRRSRGKRREEETIEAERQEMLEEYPLRRSRSKRKEEEITEAERQFQEMLEQSEEDPLRRSRGERKEEEITEEERQIQKMLEQSEEETTEAKKRKKDSIRKSRTKSAPGKRRSRQKRSKPKSRPRSVPTRKESELEETSTQTLSESDAQRILEQMSSEESLTDKSEQAEESLTGESEQTESLTDKSEQAEESLTGESEQTESLTGESQQTEESLTGKSEQAENYQLAPSKKVGVYTTECGDQEACEKLFPGQQVVCVFKSPYGTVCVPKAEKTEPEVGVDPTML